MSACIDLGGKTAFVTGVADDVGFAWHIALALRAAGADVILGCHPRVTGLVRARLEREEYAERRRLPHGVPGSFEALAVVPCDVAFDRLTDVPAELRRARGYDKGDVSCAGAAARVASLAGSVDILVHSVAFSPEIRARHMDVTREGYLAAMSVSAYSLTSLTRAFLPLVEGRGASVVGMSYLAGQRIIPAYGGAMASAKAALESDARYLAAALGPLGHRVNIVSAGPYASRSGAAFGDFETKIRVATERSPLQRPIAADDVANAALFLCSELASAITGQVLFVDAGFSAMAPSAPSGVPGV